MRVDQNDRDPRPFGLVGDVLPELVERPIGMFRSLLAFYRSLTDATQIFQGNGSVSVIRNLYDPFANEVIGYFLEASLPTGNFLEFPFGRFRLLLLQILSAMSKSAAIHFDGGTTKAAPVTIRGNIHDPQIHSQNPLHLHAGGSLHLANRAQIELAFDEAQITFPTLAHQQFQLAFAAGERDGCPTCHRPDGDRSGFHAPGQDAIIKSNRPMWSESPLCLVVKFISIGHLGNTTDHHLSRELKHFLDRIVSEFMQRELAEGLIVPSLIADVVTGSIRHFQRLTKRLRLFRRRQELYLSDQLHVPIVSLVHSIENQEVGTSFPPQVAGVSVPRSL